MKNISQKCNGKTKMLKSIYLFSGIDGIHLGFKQAFGGELKTFFVSEWDDRANFSDDFDIAGDITKISESDIPNFDICLAGFPCQAFSLAGQRKGFGDDFKGMLCDSFFFEVRKVKDARQPKIVFLENVTNLTKHTTGKIFSLIHNELAGRGCYIRYIRADDCDYGISQHRTRTYIVALKGKTTCDNFRFSDLGITSSKDGIAFILNANIGTYPNQVPIIKDALGIRSVTPSSAWHCKVSRNHSRFQTVFPNVNNTNKPVIQ